MFSNIPGLYTPEASGPTVMATKNVSRHCQMYPEHKITHLSIETHYFKKYFYLFIWLHWVLVTARGLLACHMWDLGPWPRIEPGPPALGAQSPSHWTTREVLRINIFNLSFSSKLQMDISNCLTDTSTWMSNKHPYLTVIKPGFQYFFLNIIFPQTYPFS